uniref:Uncharacterized protein n=1 Tax=Rhipicephalus appendiculatus TaxID=34631 RepID=A0A131YBW7_RHIAP
MFLCTLLLSFYTSQVDGCPSRRTVFRYSDDEHLEYFISCPHSLLFVCVLSISLSLQFFFFLRHIRSTKQKKKTIGACYLHFYVDPTSFFFFSSIIACYYNLAPAQQFSS